MFRYATPRDRLLAHAIIDPVSLCWHWTGSRNNVGRPRIAVRIKGRVQWVTVARYIVQFIHNARWGRNTRRHRVGAHQCDYGGCVNPEHVTPSTQRRNVRACVERGRHVSGYYKITAMLRERGRFVRALLRDATCDL